MKRLEVAILAGIFAVAGLSAEAAVSKLKPAWTRAQLYQSPNVSFLLSTDRNVGAESESLEKGLMAPETADELRRRYERLETERQYHEQAGLAGPQYERDYAERLNGLRSDAFAEVKRYQRNQSISRVRTAAGKDENLTKPVPRAVIGALTVMTTNAPVDFLLSDSSRLTARTNVLENTGQLDVNTPALSSSFLYAPRSDERYRVSLGRDIPGLDVSSGLSYASSSNTVSTGIGKELYPNLTAEVGTRHSLAAQTPVDKAVRFKYEYRF